LEEEYEKRKIKKRKEGGRDSEGDRKEQRK
jgi:hypothetical protein